MMINQSIYQIAFNKLTKWLLPTFLRKNKWSAWLMVLLTPIRSLYDKKQLWRSQIRYNMQHNGQVIYLEKVLNEYYLIAGYNHQDHQNTKLIYIGAGEQPNQLYIYTIPELQPVPIYTTAENQPLFIYTESEMNAQYAEFIVWVPVSLLYIEAEMRALIDYYIDTKLYKIKTY